MASTWVLKSEEHAGAYEDLVKNVHYVVGTTEMPLAA